MRGSDPATRAEWLRATLRGVALLGAVGGGGAVLLAAAASMERAGQPFAASALPSLLLLLLLAAGGAAGGAVYHATAPLRGDAWGRTAASWCLCAYASLVVPVLGARALLPRWHGPRLDREAAAFVTGAPGLVLLAASATLFGLLMAETMSAPEAEPPLPFQMRDSVPRGTMLTWVAVFLAVGAAVGLLSRDTTLAEADTRDGARNALADVRQEAQLRPNDAHVQLVLGRTLMRLDRFDEALPALERAERLAPKNEDAWNAAGWVLNQQRRFDDAVPHLREAVRLAPDYGHAHHNLGWALAHIGRMAEAEVAYRNAVRLKPEDAGAAYEFSMVLYERDEVPAALVQATRAAQLDPSNVRYHYAAACLLRSQARFSEAKVEFERVTQLDPGNPGAWAELGVTEYLMHDAAGAAAAFDEAARRDSLFLAGRPMERRMWRAAKRGGTPAITIEWRAPAPGARAGER